MKVNSNAAGDIANSLEGIINRFSGPISKLGVGNIEIPKVNIELSYAITE
jgi:hypothetical protein